MISNNEFNIKKNVLWNSIGNFVYWGCNWLMTILIVRIGNYNYAGILSLSMSISSTLYCISAYGVYNYQVSDLANKFTANCYMTARKVTVVIGMAICMIVCMVQRYNIYTSLCILMYMIYKSIEAFTNVIQAEEQKYDRMDLVGKSYIVRGVGLISLFYIFLELTNNLFITIAVLCLYSGIVYFSYDKKMVTKLKGEKYETEHHDVAKLLVTCLPMALYWLFNTLTPTIPKILIENQLGEKMLGYYASLSSPLLIITMAANFVFTPLISVVAKYYSVNNFYDFKRTIRQISLFIFLAAILSFFCARPFLRVAYKLLYGEEIIQYIEVANVMVLVVILATVLSFLNIVLTIFRRLWYLVVINGVGAGICYVGCLIYIQLFGLQGANYSLLFSYITQVIFAGVMLVMSYKRWIKRGEHDNGKAHSKRHSTCI